MIPNRIFAILAVIFLAGVVSAADPYSGYIPPSVSGSEPLTVAFTDISYGFPTSCNWTRTDVISSPSTHTIFSTSCTPPNTIFYAGNWSIQEGTTNEYGTNMTPANIIFVNVTGSTSPSVVDFTANVTTLVSGQAVLFTDNSTNATSGSYLYAAYPDGIYQIMTTGLNATWIPEPGNWSILHNAWNSAGGNYLEKVNYIHVSGLPVLPPIANFTPRGEHYTTIIDTTPETGWVLGSRWRLYISEGTTIQFNDTSTGGAATSYNWSFQKADGTWIYNSSRNASQYFDEATFGTAYRSVIFNVSNAAGSSSLDTTDIVVREPPVVPIGRYSMSSSYGTITVVERGVETLQADSGSTVTFTDVSYNSPVDVTWEIAVGYGGYGTSYYHKSPGESFNYTVPAIAEGRNITITFTAANEDGDDMFTAVDVLRIVDGTPPPSIASITNQTGVDTVIWNWTQPGDVAAVRVWKDGVLFENVTLNGTVWTGLSPTTTYEIATKTIDAAGNINTSFVNKTTTTLGSSWNWTGGYDAETDYYWVCPTGVTSVTLDGTGPGGSGKGGQSLVSAGSAGEPGDHATYVGVTVVPGTSYLIHLGKPGANASYNTDSNTGTATTALGKTFNGGLGGVTLTPVGSGGPTKGGDAANGVWSTVRMALNGTQSDAYDYGVSGLGFGAPGGGGSHDTSVPTDTQGGHGAPAFVRITASLFSTGNNPDFSASPTESGPGTLVHFTDLSTISDTAGLTYNWSFGDNTFSATVGDTQHVYSYTGSYDVSLTLTTANGSVTETKPTYINIVSEPPVVSPYFPNTVRFTVLNYLGSNVVGATVNATYVQSTLPGGIEALKDAYHIDSATAAWLMSSNVTMSGQTGDDGAIVFSMHPSLQYNVTAISSQGSVSAKVYPKEGDYNLWLPRPNISGVYRDLNVTLTFSEPSAAAMTMGAEYQDITGTTTSLLFYVNRSDGTPIHYETTTPGVGKVTFNKSIPNVHGEAFYWGIRGTRPAGNVSLDQGVTAKGPNGVRVDLRLPNTSYYPWIAIFLLFLITSLASKSNLRFFAIIIPLMAALFWWFGWLQGTYLGAVIPFTAFLGAIYYMKGSLRENYGIGGSGSMLMNIVVFLLIFQMMIGFINGLGVFDKSAIMADQVTKFSNVDLTDVQTGVQNIGGINDPLQSANAVTTVGWAAIKVGLSMIVAAFAISITLTEMFPTVPPAFFGILNAIILMLYVLFFIKLFWRAGSEVEL